MDIQGLHVGLLATKRDIAGTGFDKAVFRPGRLIFQMARLTHTIQLSWEDKLQHTDLTITWQPSAKTLFRLNLLTSAPMEESQNQAHGDLIDQAIYLRGRIISPNVFEAECGTPRQMQLANAFCRYLEMAERI